METKLATAEAQVRQDATAEAQVRKERDDLCLTMWQLRSERKTARRECNVARQQVFML
jgi:hypothetical protein